MPDRKHFADPPEKISFSLRQTMVFLVRGLFSKNSPPDSALRIFGRSGQIAAEAVFQKSAA
jgi:hypothetical protein